MEDDTLDSFFPIVRSKILFAGGSYNNTSKRLYVWPAYRVKQQDKSFGLALFLQPPALRYKNTGFPSFCFLELHRFLLTFCWSAETDYSSIHEDISWILHHDSLREAGFHGGERDRLQFAAIRYTLFLRTDLRKNEIQFLGETRFISWLTSRFSGPAPNSSSSAFQALTVLP